MGVGNDENPMRLTSTQRERSRQLRATMTDAERKLWSVLRRRNVEGLRFRRQFPIGRYVADFVCLESRLVVEVDGGQHNERSDYDATRDRHLAARGFRVLRVWNSDVMGNLDGVAESILDAAAAAQPHPVLPPSRGKERKEAAAAAYPHPVLSPSRGKERKEAAAADHPHPVLPPSRAKERTDGRR